MPVRLPDAPDSNLMPVVLPPIRFPETAADVLLTSMSVAKPVMESPEIVTSLAPIDMPVPVAASCTSGVWPVSASIERPVSVEGITTCSR